MFIRNSRIIFYNFQTSNYNITQVLVKTNTLLGIIVSAKLRTNNQRIWELKKEQVFDLGPEDREDNELLMEDSKELAQSAPPPAIKSIQLKGRI